MGYRRNENVTAVDQPYTEKRSGEYLNVQWGQAVPQYARMVASYGFLFGFCLWILVSESEGLELVKYSLAAGGVVAGFSGGVAVIIKDVVFPYIREKEITKEIPRGNIPADAKPRPFMRTNGNVQMIGVYKLSIEQWLSFATAIVEQGERMISRRKLQGWKVVADRTSKDARQIIDDLIKLDFVVNRGNNEYEATNELVSYLVDMFPALQPPTRLQ